jgi:hypothetical protein
MMLSTIVRLKVTLRGVRPPVWRRIEIAADTTLFALHRVMQKVTGWTDGRFHLFVARGVYFGLLDGESDFHRENERRVRIQDLLRRPKDRMTYEYDCGDGWEHEIVVEVLEDARPDVRYPRVIAGKRAGPPEAEKLIAHERRANAAADGRAFLRSSRG